MAISFFRSKQLHCPSMLQMPSVLFQDFPVQANFPSFLSILRTILAWSSFELKQRETQRILRMPWGLLYCF